MIFALLFSAPKITIRAVVSPRSCFASLALALLLALNPNRMADAYVLNGHHWPDGSQIMMHLGLSHSPNSFQDGSTSWNDSATDALSIWNQYINKVQLVPVGSVASYGGDGINSALFSKTMYGQAFGNRVLAVTLTYLGSSANIETDVIFNDNLKWSSYRGPVQYAGNSYIYDFHRTALHEFGHVLGLDHPDEHGQSVDAIMNSVISDRDSLSDDDIAGGRALYGLSISSPQYTQYSTSGSSFTYQITANNDPTSYSATGLPTGLAVDPSTGLISGRCTTSGTFNISIVVQGSLGNATGTFQLVVSPLPISSPSYPPAVVLGESFTYQISASNNPTTFSATGLPPGLSLDPMTGVISGVPAASGSFYVTVKASGPYSEAGGSVTIVIERPAITSPNSVTGTYIGGIFAYQIKANNHPSSFSAANLPSGLKLDALTGMISGVATLSGTFLITLTAHGTAGDATSSLYLTIYPLSVPTIPAATIPLPSTGSSILMDVARERLYALQPNALLVFDAKTFALVKTIAGAASLQTAMSISADGRKLWLTGETTSVIRSIDLETLTVLPNLYIGFSPYLLRQAADNTLYVTDRNGGVCQVNPDTGATLVRFPTPGDTYYHSYGIEISPDRRTLYTIDSSSPSRLDKYDLSNGSPVLLQNITLTNIFGGRLTLTPAGDALLHTTREAGSGQPATTVRSTADLNTVLGSFGGANSDAVIAITSDGRLAFRGQSYTNAVSAFDLPSGNLARTINLPGQAALSNGLCLAVDNTNLFALGSQSGQDLIYVYPLAPAAGVAPPSKSLLNVSTRLRSQTGDNVLIGGFIITGTQPKKVTMRAIGPSLPLSGALADPVLELHGSDGGVLAINDNWNEHRGEVIASGLPPSDEHEAVLVSILPPGAYTTILRGLGAATGVALIELYDSTPESDSRISNLSTRGRVETGDNVMIGGFIIGGDQPTRVMVRALGPSLAQQGVGGPLLDTTLTLYNGAGTALANNDDWRSEQEQEIVSANLAPADPRESALIRTLPAGNYTAIVRGNNQTSGVALVEVYNLDSN